MVYELGEGLDIISREQFDKFGEAKCLEYCRERCFYYNQGFTIYCENCEVVIRSVQRKRESEGR